MSAITSSWSPVETYRRFIVLDNQDLNGGNNDPVNFSDQYSGELSQNFSSQTSSRFEILRRSNTSSCRHCVQIMLEMGHTAKLRIPKSNDGRTHDWEMFLRFPNQPDHKLQHFIQNVEFHLHDSFASPKIVMTEPPFLISQSGYATFLLFVDIHLRKINTSKPVKLRFSYNLALDSQQSLDCLRYEKLVFVNPEPNFKSSLILAGGVELLGCEGTHPACFKCQAQNAICPIKITSKNITDSGLGKSLEFSNFLSQDKKFAKENRAPIENKSKRVITFEAEDGLVTSTLAARYKPTPEKLKSQEESTLRTKQSKDREKKVRFAKDHIFVEMFNQEKRGRGRPRKYPVVNKSPHEERHQSAISEPFATPKKVASVTPQQVIKKRAGRPRKLPAEYEHQKTVDSSINEVTSFFHAGPSLGTRNYRKTIIFEVPQSHSSNQIPFNVTLPNFLVAPHDEDDSGSTDYDDDDDDIILIEDEKDVRNVTPLTLKPPTSSSIVAKKSAGRKRGRPPKKSIEGHRGIPTSSVAKNPFPMLPIAKEKRKRGRPPKKSKEDNVNNTNSMRLASIDSALYNANNRTSSITENEHSRVNFTQDFSSTILSSTSNILTSTPLKSSILTNSNTESQAPNWVKSDELLSTRDTTQDEGCETSHIKEEISEDKLLDLQQKLSNISDPAILRKVVKIIEQSGRYRIDGTIFDFDLCTLDNMTLHNLIKCFE